MTDKIYRMHVFEGEGNKFVFLNKFSYYLDDPDSPMTPGYDASTFAMLSGQNLNYNNEYIDVPEDKDGNLLFEHVRGELISPIFLHGGCHCYYISGPVFDSVKNEEKSNG